MRVLSKRIVHSRTVACVSWCDVRTVSMYIRRNIADEVENGAVVQLNENQILH